MKKTNKNKYIERRSQRIQHLHDCAAMNLAQDGEKLRLLENKQGDLSACVRSLSNYPLSMAILTWYEEANLFNTRQWFYLTAKLIQYSYILDLDRNKVFYPGPLNFELLYPLISNHQGLVQWYANCDDIYDKDYTDKVNSDDFLFYQSIVALRGEWDELASRCEKVIANPPARLKKWHDYHYFYQALAEGNKNKMETVLTEMVAPQKLRTRVSEEDGYTENLMFTRVIIAMKIAWLHGFEVEVDSPYVPMEWMPMTPNEHYDNYYGFLEKVA